MTRFLKKSFIFILPVLSIFICTEFLLRNIPNDYKLKNIFLDKYSSNLEILCLGNSHAYYGINPYFFNKKCFNAAYNSQSIDHDLQILNKYQYKLHKLEYIIIPISYITLYIQLNKSIESWRIKNYSIYYNIHTSNNIKDYFEVLSNDGIVNIKRLYKYYIRKDNMISCSELGFGIHYHSSMQHDFIKEGIIEAKLHKKKNDLFFIESINILKSIIQFAKKNKIIVIFFTPPAYYTYRDNLDPNQLETTINTLNKIQKEYNNVIYKNYMYDKRFIKSDFYDPDHLNEIGGERLTKILNNLIMDIEKYGLYYCNEKKKVKSGEDASHPPADGLNES
jgi:hypothetical protein